MRQVWRDRDQLRCVGSQRGIDHSPAFAELVQCGLQLAQLVRAQARRRCRRNANARRKRLTDIHLDLCRRRFDHAENIACGPVGRQLIGIIRNLVFADRRPRLRRARLPHGLHEFWPLLAQNSLHTADGIALAVKQMPDAAEEIHVVGTILPPPSGTLHWPDLREPAFPEAQHVLRQVEIACHLANGTKGIGRLVVQSRLLQSPLRAIAGLKKL